MQVKSIPYTYSIPFDKISCSKKIILRAMAYADEEAVPEPIDTALDHVMLESQGLIDLRGAYVIASDVALNRERNQLSSHGQLFNTKQIVTHQLRRSEKLAWFLCTAGAEISDLSKKYLEEGDAISSYCVDVLANVATDAAMDLIQDDLKVKMNREGFNITNRYSPGYCGWDITEQKELFKVFPPPSQLSVVELCHLLRGRRTVVEPNDLIFLLQKRRIICQLATANCAPSIHQHICRPGSHQ